MSQSVKVHGRVNLRVFAGFSHAAYLVGLCPWLSVRPGKDQGGAFTAHGEPREERLAFFREHDVAGSTALACADCNRGGVGVEVGHLQPHQLTIAASRRQGGLDEGTEVGIASVNKPPRLGHRQIANAGGIDILEWL